MRTPSSSPFACSSLLLPILLSGALAVAVAAAPAAGQSVYGRVLASADRVALPGAEVALFDPADMTVLTSTRSDSTGTYALDAPRAGTYLLVAMREGYAATPPRALEVGTAARERVDVMLDPLADLAARTEGARRMAEAAERACGGRLGPRASAVMGVVRDSVAGVTLTGVTVVLEQVTGEGRLRRVREATTDEDGFFAFCPLPAPHEVAVRADLGERSVTMGVETEAGTGAFLNLNVGLATASVPSSIVGTVRDWSTGEPLPGSTVTLADGTRSATTDAEGRFVFYDLPYGVYVVRVEHLGYAGAREAFYLNGGATANVEVSLSVEAIEVDPIVVSVDRGRSFAGDLDRFEERRSAGFGLFLTAEDLELRGIGPASPLSAALQGLPSVRVSRQGPLRTSVQLRSAYNITGGACEPTLWVDGTKVALDPDLGWSQPIGAIRAIEVYRGPAEVPGEFSGSDAACGVVVVWTRRGR